ncbi:hypothetical protein FNH05_11855 [Amycolatopsis rhizosphaerae]|uniref:Uncharacterized protein n=1 Tax=Amycolatopsis rhizosphaerae TaxID=2053003 RepID=A0A558CXD7_9PSEU|nr:hypothetical protein [Amycolatopsis rhizosphaerae]TVT53439.1 hypothetical protein FNH05_11855 [Amycolatopsis rhizosphaerae]
MNVQVTPTEIVVALSSLVALMLMWRSGARRARRAAEQARASVRVVSLAGRVLLTTAGMVGVQWLVFTYSADVTLRLVALVLPDLVAAYVVTRALAVTELGTARRYRGDRR